MELEFKYIFDEDYNPVYVNGAQGGITPQGEIMANFYLERLPVPLKQVQEVSSEGRAGNIVRTEPDSMPFIRCIKSGIVMNLQTAISVHEWLGRNIADLERIQADTLNNKE